MYEHVKGEYSHSLVWREKPEPPRIDPKLDEIKLGELLKTTGWDVETLNFAIDRYAFPKPTGRRAKALIDWSAGFETLYSRAAIQVWRETVTADLRRLGFTVKA